MEEDAKSKLIGNLRQISDPRIERTKRHPLLDILVIAVLTTMYAAETYPEMEEYGYILGVRSLALINRILP